MQRLRRVCVCAAFGLAGVVALAAPARADGDLPPLEVGTGERLLVIAPHPDDETIASGGLIQQVLERDGSVHVVLMTAGDGYRDALLKITPDIPPSPAEYVAYGERRLVEARAGTRELGHDRSGRIELEFLGFPDGGLKALLDEHWQRSHPERSPTTGASDPPYDKEALEPNLPYSGANLRAELERIVRETRPTMVCLPDPADIHPDHSAAGTFALLAIDDWQRSLAAQHHALHAEPRVVSYLVHWPNWPGGWTERAPTLGELSATDIEVPNHLPARDATLASLTLTADQIAHKRAALAKYASQLEISPGFLNAFVRRNELFVELGATTVHDVIAKYPWASPAHTAEAAHHPRGPTAQREDVRER